MKRLISSVLILCLLSFFTCSCVDEVTTETPSTISETLEEEAIITVVSSEEKTTILPDPTYTKMTAIPTDTVDAFDMTLNGEGVSAVWWWDRGKTSKSQRGEYLDFLEKNCINEIYLCWPNFSESALASFVLSARERGIKVSLLSGDASWIYPDNKGENTVVAEFLEYQKNATPEAKLSSLHLDVEPHQLEAFYEERDVILQYYADFVLSVSGTIRDAGECIEWDIPFWFDGFMVKNENMQDEEILELLARNSDTLCMMSYRDSAAAVLECVEREMELSKKYGCRIVLGVETHSSEGDHVSFAEEGKENMYRECEKIYDELSKKFEKEKFGIAIHYLDTWYKLKD